MTRSPVIGDPGAEYLDRARAHEFFARLKAESLELLDIEPGDRVVDVGSGTGDDAAAMSAVAPDVFSVGLDISVKNVLEARRRHGRNSGVAFVLADGHALPLRSGCLNGCRAERTLQHIADAGLVVVEIARTLRPGGRVVFSEPDWPSCVLAGASEPVSEQVLRHWIRRNPNPLVGRNLPGLLVDAGLNPVDLRCEAVVYRDLDEVDSGAFPLRRAADQAAVDGLIERRAADSWIADLAAASVRGQFVFSVPLFTVVGVKPRGT